MTGWHKPLLGSKILTFSVKEQICPEGIRLDRWDRYETTRPIDQIDRVTDATGRELGPQDFRRVKGMIFTIVLLRGRGLVAPLTIEYTSKRVLNVVH